MISTTGMMLRKPSDLVGLLIKTNGPVLLFVDEAHAASRPAMESLYTILEDGKIDVLSGSGTETIAMTHYMPELVVMCATTRPGLLTQPFRDRFGFVGQMSPYSEDELAQIVSRLWTRKGIVHPESEALELARRSKGVPRRALHLGERVLDYISIRELEEIPWGTVDNALAVFGIDANGLDDVDFKILHALTHDFAGRTVGLNSLAQICDLDPKTLEDQHEPHLARAGLIIRAETGRMASPKAYELTKDEDD